MPFDCYLPSQKHCVCYFWVALFIAITFPLTSALAMADDQPIMALDVAWNDHYISQGRNNLANGGIVWGVASVAQDNLVAFAVAGRATQVHYIEWNAGLEYTLQLHDEVDLSLGYQRVECYGAERTSDNEFFSSLTYNGIRWLVPTINYTFATEAAGYFVELSLHSPWDINERLTLTPYLVHGVDFQYSSEQHNGANHVQFGLEVLYQLTANLTVSAQLSRTIALEDIKLQARTENHQGSLDTTYTGVHIGWTF